MTPLFLHTPAAASPPTNGDGRLHCDCCGYPETPATPLKEYGVIGKGGHRMHEHCRSVWLRGRREQAR